ncbi:type I polyketide synthase [Pleionea sediminis]|uniref:type I polyketide synthase n=1 Tax=Pleionea sediminis TaxID=2569479 RepID=UPI0011848FCA|nr:type I polyketide synthase [Pleionea sediminis]
MENNTEQMLQLAIEKLQKRRARIEELEQENKQLKQQASQEFAIIGLAVDAPGGIDSPDELWSFLCEGVPAKSDGGFRWPEQLAQYLKQKGIDFVNKGVTFDRVDQFDPLFFGMSATEAERIDPQHRMLLKLVWRAFEDARLIPSDYSGKAVGVFVSCGQGDLSGAVNGIPGFQDIDAYTALGAAPSVSAGRISYFYDFKGPTLNIDSSCSSTLSAIHLACQSLQQGDCQIAVAGGANLILTPASMLGFSRLNALSEKGQCQTFDDRADGYLRAEGGGMLLIKKLEDAVRDEDQIWGVVSGSAMTHDGRSNGLSAPNGRAQVATIRAALNDAGINGNCIQYVETHGTGTRLGDPIEIQALSEAIGKRDNDLLVGSVKASLGHLEAAAGVLSVIKVLLMIRHQSIPPQPYGLQENPLIHWQKLSIQPAKKLSRLEEDSGHYMGVSGFGMSGTNVHLIIKNYQKARSNSQTVAQSGTNNKNGNPLLKSSVLPLSAKSLNSLKQRILQYREAIGQNNNQYVQSLIALTQSDQTHFSEFRLAVDGSCNQTAIHQLSEKLETLPDCEVGDSEPKIAFVISGQDNYDSSLARSLFESSAYFKTLIEGFSAEFARLIPDAPESLISLMTESSSEKYLQNTRYAQPVIFALNYSLCSLLKELSVPVHMVAGHSLGEWVAATIAGVISVDEAFAAVIKRGARMSESLPGRMAVVYQNVELLIPILPEDCFIAGINGSEHTVVSGSEETILRFSESLKSSGATCTLLRVQHAFHSPAMEQAAKSFASDIHQLSFRDMQIPLVSNVSGDLLENSEITLNYWRQHMLQPVQFQKTLATLKRHQVNCVIEVAAKKSLLGMWGSDQDIDIFSTAQSKGNTCHGLDHLLCQLFEKGIPFNWPKVTADLVHVLPYPFDEITLQDVYQGQLEKVAEHLLNQSQTTGSQSKTFELDQVTNKGFLTDDSTMIGSIRLIQGLVDEIEELKGQSFRPVKLNSMSKIKSAKALRVHWQSAENTPETNTSQDSSDIPNEVVNKPETAVFIDIQLDDNKSWHRVAVGAV